VRSSGTTDRGVIRCRTHENTARIAHLAEGLDHCKRAPNPQLGPLAARVPDSKGGRAADGACAKTRALRCLGCDAMILTVYRHGLRSGKLCVASRSASGGMQYWLASPHPDFLNGQPILPVHLNSVNCASRAVGRGSSLCTARSARFTCDYGADDHCCDGNDLLELAGHAVRFRALNDCDRFIGKLPVFIWPRGLPFSLNLPAT
jgi:hypothetical protein